MSADRKIKLPVFVMGEWRDWTKSFVFQAWPWELKETGHVLIAATEIEVEVPPDSVLQAGTIAAYRAEQQRIRAEAEVKVGQIEQTIREMLSIEDKREEA